MPRIATPPEHEKLIGGTYEDHMESHCIKELMDAVHEQDVNKFRSAVQALVMNMFEHEEESENEPDGKEA